MTPTVQVELGERSYPVIIGRDNLDQLGTLLEQLVPARRATVITNPVVKNLFGGKVSSSLGIAHVSVDFLEVPEGEEYKSLGVASKLYQGLASLDAHRYDPIVALGGGVIGDLAGFVAATYMRGVPFVQVPTTLLAQVDSSVGGKVAVNLPQGKNLVGSFYQPDLVFIDVGLLKTLPEREFKSGLAEVVKYGFIRDVGFLKYVEESASRILARDDEVLEQVVCQSCSIKAHFVEADEKDRGVRAHLNYGHTIGHALEASSQYRAYAHGEAVAIGMMGAALVSQRLAMLGESEVQKHETLLARLSLPVKVGKVSATTIREQMEIDKKFSGEINRFVLLKRIGEATVVDQVATEIIDGVLRELGAD